MLDTVSTLAQLFWAACAALAITYIADQISRVHYVTLADGRKALRRLPLLFRIFLPFSPNFSHFASHDMFKTTRERYASALVAAGMERLVSPKDIIALRILLPLAGGVLWCVALHFTASLTGLEFSSEAILAASGVAALYLYPGIWLRGEVKKRHLSIMKALPFVLDLLTLSVEAGMDFMSALARNAERKRPDALNEELLQMVREIQLGMPRRTALNNLAARTGEANLKSVVHALVQADELGVSVGAILRIQSDQLRARRFDRAEKLANEAPVKMLGPLLLCIFPAVFVILLGPIVAQSAKMFM